jgi:hypothetical protein
MAKIHLDRLLGLRGGSSLRAFVPKPLAERSEVAKDGSWWEVRPSGNGGQRVELHLPKLGRFGWKSVQKKLDMERSIKGLDALIHAWAVDLGRGYELELNVWNSDGPYADVGLLLGGKSVDNKLISVLNSGNEYTLDPFNGDPAVLFTIVAEP